MPTRTKLDWFSAVCILVCFAGIVMLLAGCAGMDLVSGGAGLLQKANLYANAVVEEKQAKIGLWLAITGALAALVPMIARWVDHKLKKK